MKWWLSVAPWVRLVCVSVLLGPIVAWAGEVRVSSVPAWVEPHAPDVLAAAPAGVSQGIHYLLFDMQTRLEPHGRSTYRHFAARALSTAGVESLANLEISFDPSYQTLTLHFVQLRRDGRVIAKLDPAKIRVLQREKDLEALVYDGSKTANLFLDDVRVGDVIEYAYTLQGANPVFDGRLFGRFDLQWGSPLRDAYARLVVPRGREVHIAYRNTDVRPLVSEQSTDRSYGWHLSDVPARLVDDGAPTSFDPYEAIEWTEYADWSGVNRWAQPLYATPSTLTPPLRAVVDRIARAGDDPAQRLTAALQYVQREVRYLGVEIGPGSHAPNRPDVVLRRRFGDCKDKALLLVTLLRALGIEAAPALVNTSLRGELATMPPSPGVFNHVIVRARLSGQDYWLDATRTPQMSALASLYQPDYQQALVIADGTRQLTAVHVGAASRSTKSVHVVFDARGDDGQPVPYTVETVVEGGSAEAMRSRLAGSSREDLQQQYLNFYARYYPKVSVQQPFTVDDDQRRNRITVTEHYLIADFWQRAKRKARLEAQLYAPDLLEALRVPSTAIRTSPLALPYPVALTHVMDVQLPSDWSIKPKQATVDNPAFRFERSVKPSPDGVTLTDHFETRLATVSSDQAPRYAADVDRARDELDYFLYQPDPSAPQVDGTGHFNWTVATVGVLMLALFATLAWKVYAHDPPAGAPGDPALAGIDGWLLWVALGVIVSPLRLAWAIFSSIGTYSLEKWTVLTAVDGTAYHPLWAPELLLELGGNVACLVCSLLLAVLFFQRRRSAPKVFIGFHVGRVLFLALDAWMLSQIPAASHSDGARWAPVVRQAISSALWVSYFLCSERVRATFTRVRQGTAAQTAAAVDTAPALPQEPAPTAAA